MPGPSDVDFFCPSCAAPATAETTYCTGCGADLRYVPRAMEGGLTARQRSFVTALTFVPGLVYGAGVFIPGAAGGLSSALAGVWAVLLAAALGRVAYMLVRDGSSPDPIFGFPRRTRVPLVSPPTTKRLTGSADDATPTARL
jgi:hypothetical protein